jgi:hypothetical protein
MRLSDNLAVMQGTRTGTHWRGAIPVPHCVYTARRQLQSVRNVHKSAATHCHSPHRIVPSNGTSSMASIVQPALEETQSSESAEQTAPRVVHRASNPQARTNAHQWQAKSKVCTVWCLRTIHVVHLPSYLSTYLWIRVRAHPHTCTDAAEIKVQACDMGHAHKHTHTQSLTAWPQLG